MRQTLSEISELVDRAVEKGQFDAAKNLLEKALRRKLDAETKTTLRKMLRVVQILENSEYYYSTGNASFNAKDYRMAHSYLVMVVEFSPRYADAQAKLALCDDVLGREAVDQAQREYENGNVDGALYLLERAQQMRIPGVENLLHKYRAKTGRGPILAGMKVRETVSETVANALMYAPGPVFTYAWTLPEIIGRSGKRFIWRTGGSRAWARYATLHAEGERFGARLLIGSCTAAFFIPPHYIGLWFVRDDKVTISCLDPEDLPVFRLQDVMGNTKPSLFYLDGYFTSGKAIAEVDFDADAAKGVYPLDIPEAFSELEEILVVSHSEEQQRVANSYSTDTGHPPGYAMCTIFAFHPREKDVTVYPQVWFQGFDTQYQEIERATRNPENGRIIGGGRRVGAFELTDDGIGISRWLDRSRDER